MAKKVRTPFQKLRRRYLAECAKSGKKPLPFAEWAKCEKGAYESKSAPAKKVEKKTAKAPKVVAKAIRKVLVHKGDIVEFVDFPACRIADFAFRLLDMAMKEIFDQCEKKPAKKAKAKK